MTVSVTVHDYGKLRAVFNALSSSNRGRLFAVGTKRLEVHVKKHVQRISASRHASAAALGAKPTGHFRKGMRGIAGHATPDGGMVVIPIAGLARAYRDIEISTPTADGKNYLTIPKHPSAYGHTVPELRARGWKIFRPGKAKILLGYQHKGEEPVILFALATHVKQKRDPSLLPQNREIARVVGDAMVGEINRRIAAKGNA